MAMMLVLIGDAGPVDVTAERISELSRLGVTEVSVLRDATTVGVVLHGWAFDPQRSADEAAALVTAGRVSRRLLPVLHATVLPGD